MAGNRFDAITQTLSSMQDRRGISRLLAVGALGGVMPSITRDAAVGKNKKKKGKNKKGKSRTAVRAARRKIPPASVASRPPIV